MKNKIEKPIITLESLDNIPKIHKKIRTHGKINIIASSLVVIIMFLIYIVQINKISNKIYVLDKETGNLFNADGIDRNSRELVEGRLKVFSETFISLYFDINKTNYKTKSRKLIQLSGASVQKSLSNLGDMGFYSNMEKFNIFQTANIRDMNINTKNNKGFYEVNINVEIEMFGDLVEFKNKNEYTIILHIRDVDISASNPLGLFVEDFILKNI